MQEAHRNCHYPRGPGPITPPCDFRASGLPVHTMNLRHFRVSELCLPLRLLFGRIQQFDAQLVLALMLPQRQIPAASRLMAFEGGGKPLWRLPPVLRIFIDDRRFSSFYRPLAGLRRGRCSATMRAAKAMAAACRSPAAPATISSMRHSPGLRLGHSPALAIHFRAASTRPGAADAAYPRRGRMPSFTRSRFALPSAIR